MSVVRSRMTLGTLAALAEAQEAEAQEAERPSPIRWLVGRPPDPELAIRISAECERSQDHERLAKLPEEVARLTGRDYTFVGYLPPGGRECGHVVDERGLVCGTIQPGDSLFGERTDPS